jgi:hypothetical protein
MRVKCIDFDGMGKNLAKGKIYTVQKEMTGFYCIDGNWYANARFEVVHEEEIEGLVLCPRCGHEIKE